MHDTELQAQGTCKVFPDRQHRRYTGRSRQRLRLILGRLHAVTKPQDMDLPGLRLHELVGKRAGIWSVSVSGNWRITFRFTGEDAEIVNYEDYH